MRFRCAKVALHTLYTWAPYLGVDAQSNLNRSHALLRAHASFFSCAARGRASRAQKQPHKVSCGARGRPAWLWKVSAHEQSKPPNTVGRRRCERARTRSTTRKLLVGRRPRGSQRSKGCDSVQGPLAPPKVAALVDLVAAAPAGAFAFERVDARRARNFANVTRAVRSLRPVRHARSRRKSARGRNRVLAPPGLLNDRCGCERRD